MKAKKQLRRSAAPATISSAPTAPGYSHDAFRRLLGPQAVNPRPLREMYVADRSLQLDALLGSEFQQALPGIPEHEHRTAPFTLDGTEAWPLLKRMHDTLVLRAQTYAKRRGSAEWLFWLRRLAGQFEDVNTLESTGPYVQILAESLAAGDSRPSQPVPHDQTFNFYWTDNANIDLRWMRNAAIQLYRLQATMKRCAKGQKVLFAPGKIPYAIPDDVLENAISVYDQRHIEAGASGLDAVGLHVVGAFDKYGVGRQRSQVDPVGFAGIVPIWHRVHVGDHIPGFDLAGPHPVLLELIDLERIPAFSQSAVLTEEHVALVALLWACLNIATREPQRAMRRLTPASQWGYAVAPTENYLHIALEEFLGGVRHAPSLIVPATSIPHSTERALEVLASIEPSTFPPLCGNPLHQAVGHTLVDLVGASHRLLETLVRPTGGAGVNFWSAQFEADVQAMINATTWKPIDDIRSLIGRKISRPNGDLLTDLDAVAWRDGELILVSCKSMVFTTSHSRGDHNAMRELRRKSEAAITSWDTVVDTIRTNPALLPVDIPAGTNITGLVVLPTIPYVVDRAHLAPRGPLEVPAILAVTELWAALCR